MLCVFVGKGLGERPFVHVQVADEENLLGPTSILTELGDIPAGNFVIEGVTQTLFVLLITNEAEILR